MEDQSVHPGAIAMYDQMLAYVRELYPHQPQAWREAYLAGFLEGMDQ